MSRPFCSQLVFVILDNLPYSKFSNTFLFLFTGKMLVISGLELTKCLWEKQTGRTLIRLLWICTVCLDLFFFFCKLVFEILENLPHSKISNTFLFLFSGKMLVIRVGIDKMLVRIANREDSLQTASSDMGLHCLSTPFWLHFQQFLSHITTVYYIILFQYINAF